MGTLIAPEDLTWLLMDEPYNLMHINGLMGFDSLPDAEAVADLVMERMVRKYRVLSQVAVQHGGDWTWEDDADFTIDRHVRSVQLTDDGDETVRAYVSAQFAVPFDRSRPLWEVQILTAPDAERSNGHIYCRFHHGLGDGIRLVQMLLGLCDPVEGATPAAVGRNAADHRPNPLERVRRVVEQSVSDTIDYAGQVAASAGRTVLSTTNPAVLTRHVADVFDLVRHPDRLVDALTGIASVDNTITNSWRELGRMLLSDGHQAEAWSGRAGADKSVAWIEGVPLDGLRVTARARGATLNDVLLAAVSLALTDYLAERGVSEVTDLSWMMPVSLQPIDATLPDRLGNHFVVVMLTMPLGISDPGDLIDELHRRTSRLKNSVEPLVAFGVQRAVAESPLAVARRVTKFFTGKTIGQLSNVPGPRVAMTMAGMPVRSVLGWVPTSGDQPLGVCLFTYDGAVSVGVATDARMIPDPLHFVELVQQHLVELADVPGTSAEPSTETSADTSMSRAE